jgi:hypothetical protein
MRDVLPASVVPHPQVSIPPQRLAIVRVGHILQEWWLHSMRTPPQVQSEGMCVFESAGCRS